MKERSVLFHHPFVAPDVPNKIIFTAYSKRNFYLRAEISQFVLLEGQTPINPFLNVDYNLSGMVDKSLVRVANNTMIERADELWVFGEISDGVLTEVYLAKKFNKPVRYFVRTGEGVFEVVDEQNVTLEDVSPWLWEYALSGKDLSRWHPRLRFHKTYPLVFPAYSKRNFYLQQHISQFCLEHHTVPLNPFMLFRYFLGDSVPREVVYRANSSIVTLVDELWSFGEVSDGALAEIQLKKQQGGMVRYFKLAASNPIEFRKIGLKQVQFENEDKDLEPYRSLL